MASNDSICARGPGLTALFTWAKQARFSYAYDGGLTLYYGKASSVRMSADMVRKLCSENKGKMMAPFGADSLDEWVKTKGIQTRVVSYLAPALIDLGLIERVGDKIRFRP